MTFIYCEDLSGLPRPLAFVPSRQPFSEVNLFEVLRQSNCSQSLGVDKIFVLPGSKITFPLHFLMLCAYNLLNLTVWGFAVLDHYSIRIARVQWIDFIPDCYQHNSIYNSYFWGIFYKPYTVFGQGPAERHSSSF